MNGYKKYKKYVTILIAIATIRLLFFTSINIGVFIILGIVLVIVMLFGTAIITNILEEVFDLDRYQQDEAIVVVSTTILLIYMLMVIVLLNSTEINCDIIEKVHTDKDDRPAEVDDNTYYNLTCDKGYYYIDDDTSIDVDGEYNLFQPIYENKVKNKTTNYDKAMNKEIGEEDEQL